MNPGQRTSKQVLVRWAELALLVSFFTGILILVNIMAFRHSTRFDLTPGKKFTLSPQSLQILSSLTDSLTVIIIPSSALLYDILLHGQIEDIPFPRDTLSIDEIKLHLFKRRRHLVLYNTDLRSATDHILALLD